MMSCQESIPDKSSYSELKHNKGDRSSGNDRNHFYNHTTSEDSEYNSPISNHRDNPTKEVMVVQLHICKDFEGTEDNDKSSCKVQHVANCITPCDEGDAHLESDLLYELLEFSDDKNCSAYEELHSVCSDNWDEAVTGWKNVAPYAKYFVTKKKAKKNSASEKEVKSNGILCINDDPDSTRNHEKCIWKSNVESVTYRYIPNNGQYRLHKFCKEERDWFTVRKKRSERVVTGSRSLKTSYLQIELHRQLKHDLSRRNHSQDESETEIDVSNSEEGKNSPTLSTTECLEQSVSDMYAENIHSRLNELDQEIRRDSLIRTSHDDLIKIQTMGFHRDRSSQKNGSASAHACQSRNVYLTFNSLQRKQDNLRPLEKVTPQQRMKQNLIRSAQTKMATDDNTSPSELKSQIEVTNLDLERLRIMPIAETSHSYFGHLMKEQQDPSSLLKTSKMHLTRVAGKTAHAHVISTIGIEGQDNAGDGSVQSQSIQSQKSDHSLPGVTGHRIEVPLSNLRLL